MSRTLPGVPCNYISTYDYMDALRENFLVDLNDGTAAAHVYFNLQKLAQTHYDLLNLVCQLSGGGQNERLSYLPT